MTRTDINKRLAQLFLFVFFEKIVKSHLSLLDKSHKIYLELS